MAGIGAEVEEATTGIMTKVEVAVTGTGAEMEGIVALIFQNEGIGALDLLASL